VVNSGSDAPRLGNSVRVVKQPRMRNSRKMLETRSWVFSRVKERNRKKRRPRRIGLPVRSVEVITLVVSLFTLHTPDQRDGRWR